MPYLRQVPIACLCLALILSVPNAHADPYRPLDHVWYGTKDIPNTENFLIFSIGTTATLIALAYDSSVRNYFQGHDRLNGWQNLGNFWGSGVPSVLIGGGELAYGLLKSSSHETNAGQACLEGFAMSVTYTEVLKTIIPRERPDGSDHHSFPSLHVSAAFSTAASLMDFYGPAVGVPALALGGLTAVSRLASNEHWLSDTLFGATLGYIIGHAYSLHHLKILQKESEVSFYPYFGTRSDFGVVSRIRF